MRGLGTILNAIQAGRGIEIERRLTIVNPLEFKARQNVLVKDDS
jgi:hypothetical protein